MNPTTGVNFNELKFYAELIHQQPPKNLKRFSENQSAISLLSKLDYHGITLLALENASLDAETVKLIGPRKAMMIANEVLKKKALIELFNAFDAAKLNRHILFKGSALAYSLYPSPWLRPRTDSDCLIDQSDYSAYREIFERLGYQKLFSIEGKYLSYQNTFSKKLVGDSVINIDLHWLINNRQILARTYSVNELLADGNNFMLGSTNITIPSNIDSILISCLHRLGHHHREERLTWLNDIHHLANSLSSIEWQKLIEKANSKKISAITLDALILCSDLLNTNFPIEIKEKLLKNSQQKELSQIFLQRDLPEWKYFYYDIQGLDSYSKRWRLIIESLFPSPSYVRHQMRSKSTSLAYLKRFWRGIKRVTSNNISS